MDTTVDITIPVDPETARALASPSRRAAAGRVLSRMLLAGGLRDALAEAIAEAKREAAENGLTDEIVDAELAAYNAERRSRKPPEVDPSDCRYRPVNRFSAAASAVPPARWAASMMRAPPRRWS